MRYLECKFLTISAYNNQYIITSSYRCWKNSIDCTYYTTISVHTVSHGPKKTAKTVNYICVLPVSEQAMSKYATLSLTMFNHFTDMEMSTPLSASNQEKLNAYTLFTNGLRRPLGHLNTKTTLTLKGQVCTDTDEMRQFHYTVLSIIGDLPWEDLSEKYKDNPIKLEKKMIEARRRCRRLWDFKDVEVHFFKIFQYHCLTYFLSIVIFFIEIF